MAINERHFISGSGERKSITLFDGSQTSLARPSHMGGMRVKT
jgi:hypothetical protein